MKIEPTPITLGTSGLGRHSEPGSAEERAAVDVAIDLLTSRHGFVDTSNNYSAGRSEAVLGIALRELGADGSRVISKVDQDPETGAFDRDRVLRSFEETTARLGVDRLPLVHLHDPYSVSFADSISTGGAVQGLLELRNAGVVDAIGVAAAPVPLMAKYVETGVFDAVLIHNRFTLVDHSADTVFADAKARGMAVFNAAPFGSGLLVKGPHSGAKYAYRPAGEELLEWTERLQRVCAEHGTSMAAAALHFSLRSPLIDSTVVGVSSPNRREQLDELVQAKVPDGLWDAIESLGPAPSPVDDSDYA
ncbi:aldo/keto reductase [Microbacterium phyllosphaerae]|uniref:aldo/keto reductase n=1 Tax=Microbacterium phyllosphaerae TaxID=124798 RepID=UPI002169C333|nr:aldo/keto reductase [Microbacterium phyllosphaerae]MCS3443183.1 D-threo-aldose 1-dehydrogenase [Microbacterium phyllosphaerae]